MKQIYLDNAASTKVRNEVLEAINEIDKEFYGNPSSLHDLGKKARDLIEDSRLRISKILNCKANEIIFTGSGTESVNLALFGFSRRNKNKGKKIITSKIEHHSVLNSCEQLKKEGFEIIYLNVDSNGFVDLEQLKKEINEKTILVSIMYANNDIGTIQDIKEISKICKDKNIIFHTDACQAGLLDLNVKGLGVDLMTLNSSKVYGPKGVGLLYVREGVKIEPIIFGGGQENGLRSGTENTSGIIGFAKALELIQKEKEKENKRLKELRDKLIGGLLNIKDIRLNGSREKRLSNNVNVSFRDIEGERIVLFLSEFGIYASTGAACEKGKISHVLKALNLNEGYVKGSVRFSLGKENKEEDIDYVIEKVNEVVERLKKY